MKKPGKIVELVLQGREKDMNRIELNGLRKRVKEGKEVWLGDKKAATESGFAGW